jgi:hypothetical protein
MAKIENSDITQKAIKDLRLNAALEKMPLESSDKIVLTYPLNDSFSDISKFTSSTASTGVATLYTTPTTKNFYLTNVNLGFIKDAACDVASGSLHLDSSVSGSTVRILQLPILTLTAQSENRSIILTPPLKIDRGATITKSSFTFAAGSGITSCEIVGFEK